jgi:hypothetical protein
VPIGVGVTSATSESATVTLSTSDLRLVRNLVDYACTLAGPSDMRRVIDLERVRASLDEALRER